MFKTLCLTLFTSIFFGLAGVGADESCRNCHGKVFDRIYTVGGKHTDFLKSRCRGCHVEGSSRKVSVIDGGWKKMNLFLEYRQDYLVLLYGLKTGEPIEFRVTVKGKGGGDASQTISFLPEEISDPWPDKGSAPTISQVTLKETRLTAFGNAHIGWETDTFSEGWVEYGLTSQYGKKSKSETLGTGHSLWLKGLAPQKDYHYRIMARDLRNRESFSTEHTLKVEKTTLSSPSAFPFREKLLFEELKAFRMPQGDRVHPLALYFRLSREASAVVESRSGGGGIYTKREHGDYLLKSRKKAGIDSCVDRCHPQGASHPVGIGPRGNVTVPDSLPTAPGKVMTCATCHYAHGSAKPFFARLDFDRDICVLCHLDEK